MLLDKVLSRYRAWVTNPLNHSGLSDLAIPNVNVEDEIIRLEQAIANYRESIDKVR